MTEREREAYETERTRGMANTHQDAAAKHLACIREKREKREQDLSSLLDRAARLRADVVVGNTTADDVADATLLLAAEVAALHYTHLRILHLLEDRLEVRGPR